MWLINARLARWSQSCTWHIGMGVLTSDKNGNPIRMQKFSILFCIFLAFFELSVMCCCPQVLKFCQDLNLVLALKLHWKVLEEFLSKGLENFVVDIKLMPFRLEIKTHKMPFWLLTKNSLLETFSLIFIVTLIFYSW